MQPTTVAGWSRVLPEVGPARLRAALRDARDRLVASDPGLGRLRQAMKAVLAVATTALVELMYARVLGAPPTLAVLLGAIVAMIVSTRRCARWPAYPSRPRWARRWAWSRPRSTCLA